MPKFHMRWMIRRDMAQVLEIERLCFNDPWPEEEFLQALRQRNCIGMILEEPCGSGEQISGYMLYELEKKHIEVTNFAVLPCRQRNGVGTAMMEKLVSKLSTDRRSKLRLEVRESNLDAQLFFRTMGFKCTGTSQRAFTNGEDAYVMELKQAAEQPAAPAGRRF